MEGRSPLFLTTRWTLLEKAGEPEGGEALDELCRRYWGPVHAFFRRAGCRPADAEDLTQDFFRDFMARDGFTQARKERGRFRNFLLGCVRNHFANQRKAAMRQKRGGGIEFVPVEEGLDASAGLTPEEAFEKRWAEDVVDRALLRLKREWEGKPFEVLAPYLSGDRGAPPMLETAERLGFSLAATKSAVHRLRRRLGDLVRSEVAASSREEDGVAEELEHLLRLLSRS
ncbi:MAG: sigma-70 family RNA polymerase sigma factor [Akkermansiaceae bacterium]|jgi:RNA polymerase sigma-70 factor (ECF subfamily)|nr:sigma-70 family RNA polymerase sigma factor [Akkermansiaceae bacterium]